MGKEIFNFLPARICADALVHGSGRMLDALFIMLLVPVGVILWGTASAMVSYGQFMFPKGQALQPP
ncbi:MAG: hypothetical protein R3C11_03300 [Planctomycetaceae bacterium]